ncbi:MAG: TonB-dependent receptor, partial [Ferruginibacter sp.]|nr:TonB-dependent receptor [Ferruginibacter sp.]
ITDQKNQFEEFINSDKYLRKNRGQFAARNGARLPFTNILDANLSQEFMVKVGQQTHKASVTFDIFNLTNLINRNAGRIFFVGNDQTNVVSFRGFQTGTTTPTFQFFKPIDNKPYFTSDVQTSANTSSRWNAQLTFRYSF